MLRRELSSSQLSNDFAAQPIDMERMRVNETELLKATNPKKSPRKGGNSRTLRAKNRNFSPSSLKESDDAF